MSFLVVKLAVLAWISSESVAGCNVNSGGSCWWFNCYKSRGPTECINGACICQSGYCAQSGRCIMEKSLSVTGNITGAVALPETKANSFVPLAVIGGMFAIALLPLGVACRMSRASSQPNERALLDSDGLAA
uniref:EB domain-containing protein n=1 Tax=Noctiluca scintillans TaxID=2966 RepID=A7WQ99_NOCSC|nr:unknown [Noctiluca scintillans]ABV22392.1 unknown [Noctiluca scintillans]